MPTETIEHKSGGAFVEAPATGRRDTIADRDATLARADVGSKPVSNQRITRRTLLIGALGAVVIAAAVFGIPWIRFVLSTASTDDRQRGSMPSPDNPAARLHA